MTASKKRSVDPRNMGLGNDANTSPGLVIPTEGRDLLFDDLSRNRDSSDLESEFLIS
jgi:hypothetical protein